ncbi:hypothetical protein CVT24_001874 [Panaeolus cyanescens]|uniref:G domain-containing protein n=1 Tax=Panaeolus cyanescens TaxID=181874 RepID=A0A409YEP0_9AGAR|nr:hypothetical protein CVT24_001874 [Panaeolus cyanescens]
MGTPPKYDFKYIRVTGQVSVEPCISLDGSALPRRILLMLMGPTGAGKSSFIEALSGRHLGIAKDQLEGFTQAVSAFKLVNVITNRGPSGRYPIYVIDTPGFSDPNVSQLEIVQKVEKWMRDCQFTVVTHVLYFTPITDIRIPGSKRRTLDMFKSLTGIETARDLTIVTSMWNMVFSEKQYENAEKRFHELSDDIWRDFTSQGTQIVKFENTQDSALSILNTVFSITSASHFFRFEEMIDKNLDIRDTPFGGRVYEDLVSSISGLRQKKSGLEVELAHPEMKENDTLREVVEGQFKETTRALERFERQLSDFGPPTHSPSPEPANGSALSNVPKRHSGPDSYPKKPSEGAVITGPRSSSSLPTLTPSVPFPNIIGITELAPPPLVPQPGSLDSGCTQKNHPLDLMIPHAPSPKKPAWLSRCIYGIKSLYKRFMSFNPK